MSNKQFVLMACWIILASLGTWGCPRSVYNTPTSPNNPTSTSTPPLTATATPTASPTSTSSTSPTSTPSPSPTTTLPVTLTMTPTFTPTQTGSPTWTPTCACTGGTSTFTSTPTATFTFTTTTCSNPVTVGTADLFSSPSSVAFPVDQYVATAYTVTVCPLNLSDFYFWAAATSAGTMEVDIYQSTNRIFQGFAPVSISNGSWYHMALNGLPPVCGDIILALHSLSPGLTVGAGSNSIFRSTNSIYAGGYLPVTFPQPTLLTNNANSPPFEIYVVGCGGIVVTPTWTPTVTVTNSSTATPTWTFIPTGTPTATQTFTGTVFTPTFTVTKNYTNTPCATATTTNTWTAAFPVNYLTGSVTYMGSGPGNRTIYITGGDCVWSATFMEYYGYCVVNNGGGTYILGYAQTGSCNLAAYYDYNGVGLGMNGPGLATVAGERYTSSGACSNPVSVNFTYTNVSGPAGTTTIGPSLVINDCSYWGFYGTATYNGQRGIVAGCQPIFIQSFSDSSYTILQQPGTSVPNNGSSYNVITNLGTNPTGLTPLYVRAWFDANGTGVFNTGDPYVDLGQITPSTDGLLLNITFDDTYVK